MKLYFSKQQKFILLAVSLLFIAFVVLLQFVYLLPVKTELITKQRTLQSEQKLVEVMGRKKTENQQQAKVNTHGLQLEIPVKPLQEQFILDLQKAATLSDSDIKSMAFSNDDKAASQTAQTQSNQQNSSTQQSANTANTGLSQQSAASNGKQQSTSIQPSGLQKLTVQLSVESPSYEDFEKFVESLESLKRLVVVETIQYTGSAEATDLAQKNAPFIYTLAVSAFYMSNLPDLEGDLPKIDTPEPSGKTNPLSQFPEVVNR